MAYDLLDIQITPGGLNLLAPGDQAKGSLDLTGWWPGAVGRLQQAPGYTVLSAAHLTRYMDSLCEASGRIYYGGSDRPVTTGDLFQVGRGGAGETAIDTGYDGYPLGLLSFQGYVWIMNRAKQRRDNGSSTTDWTPASPGAPALADLGPGLVPDPITGVLSGPGGLKAGVYDYYVTWQFGDLGESNPSSVAIPITGATNATPIVITTSVEHGLVDGQMVAISGVLGNTAANVTCFANQLSATTFALYTDSGLITPIAGSGAYTSGGEVFSTLSVTVAADDSTVEIDITSLTVPAGATGWNIYRKSAALATPFRLNEFVLGEYATYGLIAGHFARQFVFDYGDEAHRHDDEYLVEGLGAEMEADHDAAPAARIMANQVYNGRIVVANSAAYPNRIWFTPALQPGFFRGSRNPQSGDWVDVGTDRGDEILFMAVRPQMMIIYRSKSIWRVTGDFADPSSRIEVVVPDLGIVGPRAVACTSLGDFFRSPEGIHKFGDWAAKVSSPLDPVFDGTGLPMENFTLEAAAARASCALGFHAGRLWVSYTFGAGSSNNTAFVLHVETDRWFARTIGAGAFLDSGDIFLGAASFEVLTLETGYVDGVGNTIVAWQSGYEDCGQADREKTFADLVVNHNTHGQTLLVRARTNKAAATADSFTLDTTLTSAALTKTIVPLVYPAAYSVTALRGKPIRGFNLSVRIDGTGPTSAPLVIETPLVMHYYLEARQGLVFDTDETDHGMPGVVKTVDMVEFDLDSTPGAGVLQIYSDVPGGAMTARLGSGTAIAQTAGRRTLRIVLGTAVEGKLLRYVATSATGLQVYGFRARLTPIGVHVDGADGEVWDTRPIAVAA